ncbi:unnamed protein product, partial [Ectocarpus sp. 6 AP-2014]
VQAQETHVHTAVYVLGTGAGAEGDDVRFGSYRSFILRVRCSLSREMSPACECREAEEEKNGGGAPVVPVLGCFDPSLSAAGFLVASTCLCTCCIKLWYRLCEE